MQNLGAYAFGESREPKDIKTTLISRNITVGGKRTSIRLEPEMWSALKEISKREGCSIHDICTLVSLRKNAKTSLTAAIRVFLMLYFRASSTEDGHVRAGHGNFEFMKERARLAENKASRFKAQAQSALRPSGYGSAV
ncbi:MAG: ribbon-helix-helix domain-containing protein [Bdellovibrionales bacterium]